MPQMGWLRYAFVMVLWFLLPCLVRGTKRWELLKFSRARQGWELDQDRNFQRPESKWSYTSMLPVNETEDGHNDGKDNEGDDDESTCSTESTARDRDQVRCRVYCNNMQVGLPVDDQPKPMVIQVEGMHSTVVRMKPADTYKECWDLLFFISASSQLFGSFLNLGAFATFHLSGCVSNGDMCTLWWWWCCGASSLLALHKKLHARWWESAHWEWRRTTQSDSFCFGMVRIPRTPSPVSLWTTAPGIPDRPGWNLYQRRSADSQLERPISVTRLKDVGHDVRQAILKRLVDFLRYLRPLAYRFYNELLDRDCVIVLPPTLWIFRWTTKLLPSWLPVSQRAARQGHIGVLRIETRTRFAGYYVVQFEDGEFEQFQRHEIELYDEDLAPMQVARAGQWHDNLTRVLRRITGVCWFIFAFLLFAIPENVLTDSDGYLTLHFACDVSGVSQNFSGLIIFLQVMCLIIEGSIRLTTWGIQRCLLLLLYGSM